MTIAELYFYFNCFEMTKTVFVTVGTTEFDQLITRLDRIEFLSCLHQHGYSKLILQYGRGTHIPNVISDESGTFCIDAECYRYKPSLEEDMKRADLVISHCGAGSILEAITYGKMLIVVTNSSLQDNHQQDLSDALTAGNYYLSTIPGGIIDAIAANECNPTARSRKKFAINDSNNFMRVLDNLFDFDH